jgi:N-acetylglucosaminyldiphosphoundecaprenol N-acetyl-beta-D-mannosaminyltransferase
MTSRVCSWNIICEIVMAENPLDRTSVFPVETVTGYPFSTATFAETIELLMRWASGLAERGASRPMPRYFVCANPHSLEVARKDSEFHDAILAADLVTPDGAGIVLASRILSSGIRERVCGPDIFPALCQRLNLSHPGIRMFFLGSSEENLSELTSRFRSDYPTLEVAGTLSPPYRKEFAPEDDRGMIDAVNAAEADVLWLGLGAPKQEKWAYRNRNHLRVKLIGPIGGAFDWYTGRIRLPPLWMQRAGLQWFHRLCQEPLRLWRRNLDSPLFLARVLQQKVAGRGQWDNAGT